MDGFPPTDLNGFTLQPTGNTTAGKKKKNTRAQEFTADREELTLSHEVNRRSRLIDLMCYCGQTAGLQHHLVDGLVHYSQFTSLSVRTHLQNN